MAQQVLYIAAGLVWTLSMLMLGFAAGRLREIDKCKKD